MASKKGGVIGREERGLVPQDLRNSVVLLEFIVKELPHDLSVPSEGMLESSIERKVSLIELLGLVLSNFLSAYRHIKDRQVQERDRIAVVDDKVERSPRFYNCLVWCAKKKIDISGGISPISLNLLHYFEKEEIIKKRRTNYQYYLERLKDRKNLRILIPDLIDGVCPIGFPILIEHRDTIRKKLLERRINLRTFWDILPEEIIQSEHPVEYEISRKILILPVHQSLEKLHLDYTIQNLLLDVEYEEIDY